ncbi:MAG TPA: hypothetical protein VMS93_03955 [Candidatus Saccharimonadales bacterium]|nr:hypothetical protein [Candidatus Saccharimonadales bacterium]
MKRRARPAPGSPDARARAAPPAAPGTPAGRSGAGPSDLRPALAAAALAAALAALALHARSFLPFLSDDALISLRYARRLLDGQGLTWTDGPPVEGYSNLLWVLLVAGVGRLGLDLVAAARSLGAAGAAAALAAVALPRPREGASGALAGLAGALAVALAGPLAAWTVGGLEQPLVAALLAWALVLSRPLLEPEAPGRLAVWAPGLLLALLCLARPDGGLFTSAVAAALLAARGAGRAALRTVAQLALLPVLFTAGQLAFRLAYYHAWLPNPALVKVAFTRARLAAGVAYLGAGGVWLAPLWLAAAVGAGVGLARPAARPRALLLLAPLVVWGAYLAVVGGDTFPARRQLVPLIVPAAMLAAGALPAGRPGRRARAAIGLAAAGGLLAALLMLQLRDPENRRARQERWEWDGRETGLLLQRLFGPAQPLIAVDAAGAIPYWSGLPALDMLGLNDAYLPRHRPAGFGRGRMGHELGDAQYVLRRAPDLVVFCGVQGNRTGCYPSEAQLAASDRFLLRYALATFRASGAPGAKVRIWVRRDSDRIGMRQRDGEVWVPAWFMGEEESSAVTLDADGQAGVTARPDHPAIAARVPLGPGRWTVLLDPFSPGERVALTPSQAQGGAATREEAGGLRLVRPEPVNVCVYPPPGDTARVRTVVVRRVAP